MPRLRLLTILYLTFSFFPLATKGQYFFKKLTTEDGLSDNRVSCFLKDKTGFLWIGTRNSLNRYDGHSFKIFKPSTGSSISSEVILDIVQDSSGKIWVATMAGLNIYDPSSNQWETMIPDGNDPPHGLPNFIIWDLEVDKNNKIWIVSDIWALSMYDPILKKFTYYDWHAFNHQKKFEAFPGYRSIQKITRKTENEWWLGTTIGLFSLNTISREFQYHGGDYSDNVTGLQYINGKVLVTTEHGDLFCYDEAIRVFKKLPVAQQPYPASFWNNKILSDNKLLLPHPAGMLEFNTATGKAVLITHSPALSSSLLPGETNRIYTDNTGIVWVGSGNGVNFFNSHNNIAGFVPLTPSSDKETTDRMSAALYDPIERKYFITSVQSKELFIIDEQSGRISSINSIGAKQLSACTNLCTDRQNNIWLLTQTHVYRYDRLSKQFFLFPVPVINENVIFHDFLEDKLGNYWFATWHDGLYRYNTKDQTFRRFTDADDDMFERNITSLINDPIDSSVWIGTFGVGIYRYDQALDSFAIYTEHPANPDYRQLTLVRDIEVDGSGNLWLAMVGAGLYKYRHNYPFEKSFIHITSKNGLTHSSYYSITADNKNRLWLLNGKGLSVIDTTGKLLFEPTNHPVLGFADFAPQMTYPKKMFYNKAKNELLLPVAGGLLIYYPDRELPVNNFPVVFTDISVDNRSIMYDSSYASKKNIVVPNRSNSLSFQFAALNYDAQGSIQYEYKLHESDADWKSAGNSGTLNFPDLSSGRYTLMIRARDDNNNLSDITSLTFFIKPPFWKTAWFIMAVIVALSAMIFLWIRSLQRKLKAEKILNYFATSLYGQNTVDDVFWDVAKNCISQLRLEDCVIYLYQPQQKLLIQKAAYGPKNPEKHEIINTLQIPYGKGIVGSVAATEKPIIVKDTRSDSRYIVDDLSRSSEIAVPIFVEGKLFGVIDSEHSQRNYYTRWHLQLLQKIAGICSNKISKYLVAEKVRTDIARDLHDEMGSTLTSINIMSTLALQQTKTDSIGAKLQKIKDYSGDMMESMSDIVWAINPMNDSMDRMILRMRELAEELLEPARINYIFKEEGEVKNLKLDVNQRKELYLIFKEAINNAVKYSQASELIILLREEQGSLYLQVKDNGTGFDLSKNHSGSGIQNMRSRAGKINAELHISSAKGQGTLISVTVPLS